jgi:hypothetical protein
MLWIHPRSRNKERKRRKKKRKLKMLKNKTTPPFGERRSTRPAYMAV